ncbi:hypothetical protein QYF61_024296 [Mycteria americana]|uniref:Murine leukemia virus integrase C-terminal domain-containing protein n=1 Tax=Mycteria americana TaxID=33587 RepID=A0AAN7MMC3_MYCAM|nr:hypothetical protein QYF61_024296 [Mycteria americana]
MNRTIKGKIAKFCTYTGLKWPEALNIALWDIRNAPRQPIRTYILAKTSLLNGDERLTQYVLKLQENFKVKRDIAQWCQPTPPEIQVHNLQPGDKVLIKVFSCKSKLEPRWEEPYTVLLSSYFAVKVAGKETWVRHSHVKRLPENYPVDGQQATRNSTTTTTLETETI